MLDKIQKIKPNILVIGDLIIDKYLWGKCERISPEAPVQIIDIQNDTSVLGGAGNVVNNLNSLGANVSIMSVVGDCKISKELKEMILDMGISTEFLITEPKRISSKKTRVISSQQQVIRFDLESKKKISENSEKKLLELFKSSLSSFQLVILSDYGKGLLTKNITQKIIQISKKKNIKVIVDPKGNDFTKYNSSYLLTPNKKEASLATGINITDKDSLDKALLKLKKDCNLDISMITLSEDGIAILDKHSRIHPTFAKEVYDVTGAGDTVIASLGYAIAIGIGIDEAVKFANLAAGVVVSKIGSATTTFEEIRDYQLDINTDNFSQKFKTIDQIMSIVGYIRKQGKKIVFTNGCFDILHSGHVNYLEQTKKLADILIVGLNSDNSVSRLKGESRPINTIHDRANILSALQVVNYVVEFDEDTPKDLIAKIRPDYLAKGSDYKNKSVAGEEYSELVLIDYTDNKSTSNIIDKIKSI